MTLYGVELTVCADPEEVASVVADQLVAFARDGSSIALTGGRSVGWPRRVFRMRSRWFIGFA